MLNLKKRERIIKIMVANGWRAKNDYLGRKLRSRWEAAYNAIAKNIAASCTSIQDV